MVLWHYGRCAEYLKDKNVMESVSDRIEVLAELYSKERAEESLHKSKALRYRKELAALAPHKVGEVIEFDNGRKAVVREVLVSVDRGVRFDYRFHPITKDGKLSKHGCNYPRNYKWTGEVVDLKSMI